MVIFTIIQLVVAIFVVIVIVVLYLQNAILSSRQPKSLGVIEIMVIIISMI